MSPIRDAKRAGEVVGELGRGGVRMESTGRAERDKSDS